MIFMLVRRDLRGRYQASVLGFFWTFFNPLLQLGVYTVVFSVIMRANIEKYKPDRVFHFASQNSVQKAWENPAETVNININGTVNLFEAIRTSDVDPVVVSIGSGEEYGRVPFQNQPISESENPAPTNIYAVAKAVQTMMTQVYYRAYGIKTVEARVFNIIGPRQSDKFAVSDFCRQAAQIRHKFESCFRVGNLNVQRDFVDIRDVVCTVWLLANEGEIGEIYNIGTGKAVYLKDILPLIQQVARINADIIVDDKKLRPTETPKIEASIKKLLCDTRWQRKFSLEKTIQDMVDYWGTHIT